MIRATLRDAGIYMVPTILTRGLSVFMLPIYARALSPSDYGVLDLIASAGAIINVVLCLEVVQGMVRLRVDLQEYERPRMTGTAWVFSVGMYAGFIAVAFPSAGWIAERFLGSRSWEQAVEIGVICIALNAIVNLFLGQFRWELRSKAYSAFTSAYAVSTLALSAWIALVLGYGLLGILTAQCVTAAVTSVVVAYVLRDSWSLSFDLHYLRQMLHFSWPLVPSSLSIFISLYFNRLALAAFAGLQAVGLYGMGARLSSFATLLIAGIQGAVMPMIYGHYKEPDTPASLATLFNIAVALSMITGLGLHLISEELVNVLATPAYAASAGLVPLLVPAMLMSQLYVFSPGMSIAQKTVRELGVTALGASVNVILNLTLVPAWGAMGAATATLISAFVFLVTWITAAQKYYPIPYTRAALARSIGSYIVFSLAAWLLLTTETGAIVSWSLRFLIFGGFVASLTFTGLIPVEYLRQNLSRLRGHKVG